MRLKKAIETTTSYPTREHIKPILLSVSVTIALSACSHTISEPSTPIDEAKNEVVPLPNEVAGGMPAYIIPTDYNESEAPSNFKKKLHKE